MISQLKTSNGLGEKDNHRLRTHSLLSLGDNRGRLDVCEFRKVLVQVRVALHLDLALVRTLTNFVYPVDYVHALDNLGEGREP